MNTLQSRKIRRMRLGLIAILSGALAAGVGAPVAPAAAAGPGEDVDPLPITVEVEPSLVVVYEGESGKLGRKVTIKGRTLPMGKDPVTITFESDDPPLHTQTVAMVDEKTGAYSNSEFGAVEAGEYKITVTAPDGRGTAATTLTAITVPDLSEHADKAITKADDAVEQALDKLDQKIDDKPDSPAKTKAKEKIKAMRTAHRAVRQAETARAVHGFFGAIYEQGALLEHIAPQLQPAADTVSRLEEQTALIKRMDAKLSGADEACQQMDFAVEFAKALSTALGLEAKLLAQVLSMGKDVVANAAANKAKKLGGPAAGLGASLFVKNASTVAKGQSLVNNAKGIFLDFATFGMEQLFNAYCQKFAGPVEATFSAKFFRDVDGAWTMWWHNSYKLSGRMILIYPKAAKGEHVPLAGRIEGYAHSFHTWEKGLAALAPRLMGGAMVYKKYVPPIDVLSQTSAKAISQGNGPAQLWGSAATMLSPNSFIMQLRGELDKDSLTIRIGRKIKDFKAALDVVAVIVSPLSYGVGPSVTWYSLPFVDAHDVLAGGTDEQPVELKLKTVGKTMIATGKADNKKKNDGARGEYHIRFKACNPGC